MAYVMTYNTLTESAKRWLLRVDDTDFSAELPRMIDTVERKVARAIKILLGIKYAAATTATGQPGGLVQKPARWLETASFLIGTGTGSTTNVILEQRPYDYCLKVFPDATSTGQPRFYSDMEFDYILLTPSPDLAYPYQIGYYERPDPIGEDNQTNWLTTNAPDLLLYGTLLEAAPFLKADDRIPMWQKAYDDKLAQLLGEDASRQIPDSERIKK